MIKKILGNPFFKNVAILSSGTIISQIIVVITSFFLARLYNAQDFGVSFDEELRRVIAHGVLHYCGYKDKTEADQKLMRTKEEEKMKLFHVEQ